MKGEFIIESKKYFGEKINKSSLKYQNLWNGSQGVFKKQFILCMCKKYRVKRKKIQTFK